MRFCLKQIPDTLFKKSGEKCRTAVVDEPRDLSAKMDFLKDIIAMDVELGHFNKNR
jgi:hypothetical protein